MKIIEYNSYIDLLDFLASLFIKICISKNGAKRYFSFLSFFWEKLVLPLHLAFTTWKVSKYGVFSGSYFPVFSPNMGKYGTEETPYWDTFHAVKLTHKNIQELLSIIVYHLRNIWKCYQAKLIKLLRKSYQDLNPTKICTVHHM